MHSMPGAMMPCTRCQTRLPHALGIGRDYPMHMTPCNPMQGVGRVILWNP